MIQARWSQNILFGVVALILVLLTLWGYSNGTRAAKAKRIVKDANVMVSAFNEFHKDQNRYPATNEFQDINVMRRYVTNFPAQNFPTKACPETFSYYNAAPQTYELRFCLPKAVNGFEEGWNTFKP